MGGLGTRTGRAEARKVFPADEKGRRPAVYFWARTMVCPNPACQAEIPLLSSFWLANSTRRKVWVEVSGRPGKIDLRIRIGAPPAGTETCPTAQ